MRSPSGVPGSAFQRRCTSLRAARWSVFVLIGRISMLFSSNGLGIDPVVFGVRSDEANVDPLASIVDRRDQPIFVSADIEDRAATSQNISASKCLLNVVGRRPVRASNHMDPGPESLFGILSPWLDPEVPESADRDDPHSTHI